MTGPRLRTQPAPTGAGPGAGPGPARFPVAPLAVGAVAAAGIGLGIASNRAGLLALGAATLQALWLLPGLVCLHLGQLLLSAVAWRALFAGTGPGLAAFYRLRIIREGVDSLLPVAQVGGEIVGTRLLSRHGVAAGRAAASVVVDVTVELLTQVAFLAAGLAALAWLSRGTAWGAWLGVLSAAGLGLLGLVLAQRLGGLRALEALLRGVARRWPALGASGAGLAGLHAQALGFYRQPAAMLRCIALHLLAWMLGSCETWAVLNALGTRTSALQAFTVESLGMAARSAGFAIPAALGAQEGGFALAAAAVGLPVGPALALSLVKRMREVTVGLLGLGLWRAATHRPAAS